MTTQDNSGAPNLYKIFGQLPTARDAAERMTQAETDRRLTALEENGKAQQEKIQALMERELKRHPLKTKAARAKPRTGKPIKKPRKSHN